MQETAVQAPVRPENRISTWLDTIFSQPYLYAFFALISLKPRALCDMDALIASVLHLEALPLFRVTTYVIFTIVLVCYALRWLLKDIQRVNKTLLCILFMFLYLAGITFVFNGASGYHIDWHAGFALMMMIDMGLQREKKSLIRGLTGAFEFWIYLNVLSFVVFPNSFTPLGVHRSWALGNHAFYYRTVLPAMAVALVRYHLLGKKYALRTVLLLAACAASVAIQRGGTALIGIALLTAVLVWCARRALPQYMTPLAFTTFAVAVFIGIYYYELEYVFSDLIVGVLNKNTTLSGRTNIWKGAMKAIVKNPISGVGYLPVDYMQKYLGGSASSHTHNQLLELAMHGGLISVGLYLAAVSAASAQALKYRRSPAVKHAAILLCVFAVMGVVEIFHNDPIYYALFVLLSRADCLQDGKKLPRISVIKRIGRDMKKITKKG